MSDTYPSESRPPHLQSVNKYDREGGFYLNESEYQMRTVLNNT